MEFLKKDKKRGKRHARSEAVRTTRVHKKIHLGEETRPEGYGTKAPGILAKTGIRTSQPADANWRSKKAQADLRIGHDTLADHNQLNKANHAFNRYMFGESFS